MSAPQHGEKQFEATVHRREEFRKQGRFARARDAAPVAAMLGALGALLGSRGAIGEALMSILRVGVVGYIAYHASLVEVPDLIHLAGASVEVSIERITKAVVHVTLSAGGSLAAIAVIDYVQSRVRLSRDMMMTRQEFMEEMRQHDGDPKIKGRMKERARAHAKKRALQNVKRADVVVTNPPTVARATS